MSARADSLARLLERGHQRRAARVVVRGAGKRMGGMERMGGARARPAADGEDTRATAVLPLSLSLSLSLARAILAISIYDDGPLRAPFSPDGPPPFSHAELPDGRRGRADGQVPPRGADPRGEQRFLDRHERALSSIVAAAARAPPAKTKRRNRYSKKQKQIGSAEFLDLHDTIEKLNVQVRVSAA